MEDPKAILLVLDRILAHMPEGARLAVKGDVRRLIQAHEKALQRGEDSPEDADAAGELAAMREAHEWLKEAGDPTRKGAR